MPLPPLVTFRSTIGPIVAMGAALAMAGVRRAVVPALALGLTAGGAFAQTATSSDGTPCQPKQEEAAVVGGSDIQPTEAELAAAGCPDVTGDEAKETEQLYEELMKTDDPPALPQPESSQ